jgi:hypothetical protein
MAEQPAAFPSTSVQALLAGRKTQTRQLTGIPDAEGIAEFIHIGTHKETGQSCFVMRERNGGFVTLAVDKHSVTSHFMPQYAVGDRLYVLEAWRVWIGSENKAPRDLPSDTIVIYEAGGSSDASEGYRSTSEWPSSRVDWPRGLGKLRPADDCPRWASRITLVIESVKVERLHDLTEDDAIAEGVEKVRYEDVHPVGDAKYAGEFGWKDYTDHPHSAAPFRDAKRSFQSFWDRSHFPESWHINPWVVVYTHRTILQNIDEVSL